MTPKPSGLKTQQSLILLIVPSFGQDLESDTFTLVHAASAKLTWLGGEDGICYLLLPSNLSQHLVALKDMYNLTHFCGSKSGWNLARCLWLQMPHELVMKLLAALGFSFWMPSWWRSCFQAHSRGWCQALVSQHVGLSTGLPHNMAAGFPQGKKCKRQCIHERGCPRQKPQSFYNLTILSLLLDRK